MNRTLFTSQSMTFFVAIVMMVAMVAGVVLGITEVSAQVLGPQSSVTICHATASQNNPYTTPPVNVSGVLGSDNQGNAHDNHELDIIPPFEYNIGEGPQSYPGKNWDAEGIAIWENGCQVPPPSVNLPPLVFSDATCETDPSLTVPQDFEGVTFSQSGTVGPGQTVTIIATLTNGYVWGDTTGWTPNPPQEPTQYTWTVIFSDPFCPETAVLGVVGFADATCEQEPVLTLPADGNGVTYSQDVDAAPGVTVTVTATLNTDTHVWGDTTGWLPNPPEEATQLTRTFTFADPECPTPTETETPTGTLTPSPTDPAAETPTSTATETPTATATNTPVPTATTPAAQSPTKEPVAKPVSKLPNTGAGEESSPVGTVLIVAALGVAAVGGIALVIGDRKRA